MMRQMAILIATVTLLTSNKVRAQAGEQLPDYVPLLPEVRAKALVVDPQKGYLVKQLKPTVFMITGGGYESVFVTTGKGAVLFDAPRRSLSIFQRLSQKQQKNPS